jgi:hypothetical protein
MEAKSYRIVTGVLAVFMVLGLGVYIFTSLANRTTEQGSEQVDSAQVSGDGMVFSEASEIAGYSQAVVIGRVVGGPVRDLASNYRMAMAGAGDYGMDLWTVRVEDSLKGPSQDELRIAVTNPDPDVYVSTGTVKLKPDLRLALFLTEEVNGARVLIGGPQGVLSVAADGTLTDLTSDTLRYRDVKTVDDLRNAVSK